VNTILKKNKRKNKSTSESHSEKLKLIKNINLSEFFISCEFQIMEVHNIEFDIHISIMARVIKHYSDNEIVKSKLRLILLHTRIQDISNLKAITSY